VIGSLQGTTVPAALAARIRRGELAGVILFSRNVGSRAQLRALTARLQAERRRGPSALRDRPLLVMIDQEGGLVKRLSGAPDHSPGELARIGSADLARQEGLATARNLRDVGVNVDLVPVLDIGRPDSSVRSLGRSYGSTPARVEALGGAFADGLAAGGVLACARHFPGLGGATVDEDLKLNRIALPLETLRAVDEAPFRDAARRPCAARARSCAP
jgi:beta-N-acetylhexosaminidase